MHTIYQLVSGAWVALENVAYPIKIATTLDESFDTAQFVKHATVKGLVKRDTPIKVVVNGKTYYFVGSNRIERKSMQSETYKHTWTLIEPTKLLEKIFITGCAITQPLTGTLFTVLDAINKVLAVTPLRRLDILTYSYNEPKFKVDSNIESKLAMPSAEFKWTCKQTLFEVLYDIGKFIGAMPRLIPDATNDKLYNTITFDFFGELKGNVDLLYTAYSEDCDETNYAGVLETYAENLTSEHGSGEAKLVFPSKSGWVTARSNEAEIKTTNVKVILPYPIEKINKVIIKYVKTYLYPQGELEYYNIDITAYVVEYDKFLTLNPTTGTPAKNNAMYYKKGENELVVYTGVEGLFSNITNYEKMLEDKYGEAIVDNSLLIRDWEFRIEYEANVAGRLKVLKEYSDFDSALAYNQSAEAVSVHSLGKNMWGVSQAIGAEEIQAVVYDNIPNTGEIYDGNAIITKVEIDIYAKDGIKALVSANRNFNKLNEHIALNREYRQYSIPTKGIIKKELLQTEICKVHIGTYVANYGSNTALYTLGMQRILSVFNGGGDFKPQVGIMRPVSAILPSIIMGDGVLLQTTAFSFGKSIVLSFDTQDNFSAGKRKEAVGENSANIDVRYCLENGTMPHASIVIGDYTAGLTQSDDFPLLSGDTSITNHTLTAIFKTEKDVSEQINFKYQLHFVPENDSIIVGFSLARLNPIIGAVAPTSFKLWKLNRKINGFTETSTVSWGDEIAGIGTITVGATQASIIVNAPDTSTSGEGWAITDNNNNLFVAELRKATASTRAVSFNFEELAI